MPLFERAARVFNEAFKDQEGGGKAELINGNAVVLYASRAKDSERYSLTFEAGKERKIICAVEPRFAPTETFDLGKVSHKGIAQRVRAFGRAVAEGCKGQH